MLVDWVPSSCCLTPRAEPGWRQSWGLRGGGWSGLAEGKSPCSWGAEETRETALCPFSLPAKMWASCLGQQSHSREGPQVNLAAHQSLCSQRSFQHPSGCCLIHRRRGSFSSPVEITGSPGGFFLGLAQTVSQHSADSEEFPVSAKGQQLWVPGEGKLTEGAAGPAKQPRASRRRSLPPGWHRALLWESTQLPAK